jgi:hypothetical protein
MSKEELIQFLVQSGVIYEDTGKGYLMAITRDYGVASSKKAISAYQEVYNKAIEDAEKYLNDPGDPNPFEELKIK